ncbi:MAG: type II secretion system F family protein [Candidatus Moranbacteria bacterium]|nr:type II secretion system F family protein [Candidatus Moranbacteria bacterium]
MPKYTYTAKSYSGETKGGEIVAHDEKSLAQQLRGEGFLVTSIALVNENQPGTNINVKFFNKFNKVPLKEKMVFARNLSVMISSGLTVSRAVSNLALQVEHKGFKKILGDIFDEMQAGKTLSEGLAKYPGVFGDLFINMVRVGEVAGNLDEVLKIVSVQLEKEHDLKGKIKGAMIYPAVILSVMIIIGVIMLIYVLPQMMAVFEDMNTKLPPMTQFLINISNIMKENGLALALAFVFFGVFLNFFLQRKTGKKALSYFTVNVPVFSPIVKQVNCARFARIYSSLLKSGVGSVDALKIISNTLSNYYYKEALLGGMEDIQKGIPLSVVLNRHQDIFPMLVSQIVQVGEETGKTETVLLQLAEYYEDEVDQVTKNMSAIIEPFLMVIIGSCVGFFAVAMLQPMYSLMDNIQ